MSNLYKKIKRLVFKCLSVFSNKPKGQTAEPDYNPPEYWQQRHKKHGFNLTGVQVSNLSKEENDQMYADAKKVFMEFCEKQQIDLKNSHTLEIGCGIGLFAQVFQEAGGTDYTGVDITNVLFEDLNKKFPDYSFKQVDITKQQLDDKYDLIMMIDVTQHIVDDEDFFAAMENVRTHLKDDGVFVVTSWLTEERVKRTYYEVSRPMSYYKKAFDGFSFSETVDFRWKYLFSIKK